MAEFSFNNCKVEVFEGCGSTFCYVYPKGGYIRTYEMRTSLTGLDAAEVAKHLAERAGRI